MPTIRILDELNTPLLEIEPPARSGLARYLPDSVVQFMALRPAVSALRKRVADAPTNATALEFAVPTPIVLGAGDLMIDAGVRAAAGIHQADELLFPADDLRDAISVPAGAAYMSIGLSPRVSAGIEGQRGPLALGFAGGASLAYRYFHPFDIAGTDPLVSAALADVLKSAVIPADCDDLKALPVGAHASIEGEAELKLAGAVELTSLVNPLATPGLPIVGSAAITAGASVSIGAEWRASGAFEVRASRISADRIRLSYCKRAGSRVSIDAAASLGVSARIGDSDVLHRLIAAISANPKADIEDLVNAGLTDEQIEALQRAVIASIDRSLRITTEMQFSSVRRGEALLAYEIDVAALKGETRDAVEAALRGHLTPIDEASKKGDGPVRAVQTGLATLRDRRVAWRINLFGILNVHSVSELLRKGTLSYDPQTGTLNAADEIASERILVKTRPFEADGEKVRKLAFESMIVTAAYHASRVTSGVTLTCAASYFEGRHKTTAADIRADYNAIIGVGLADRAEAERRIGAEHDFGPSTFFLDCVFDRTASDALFIGATGPLSRAYYERVGRNALLALIPPDDVERAHRRAAVEQDAAWNALTQAGPAAARPDLVRRLGEVRAEHIIGDYVTIRWWADAMADAARALVEMRQFLAGRSADSLANDPEFRKRRTRLERELADVVRESKARFGDPWGLLALDEAAGRTASVQATIVSPRLTATYSTRVIPATRAVGLRELAATRAADPFAAPREAKRPLTPEEKELLRRHAVNLRLGVFSTDGEFQTSEADVRRIFTELLPEELERQKSDGRKLRVMFYAHGGLTGEREGLEPVLKRLKFWRQNNVYPISFVWETGLRETVTDIVRSLFGAREAAARGLGEDLADAFLEFAAREPGKRVWNQMKRSAELAVLEGGGGLAVAAMTRELWAAHHADMEIHAAGHSAGAIFQSHFLPAVFREPAGAGAPPIFVKTLHFLAPACTVALFESKIVPLVGSDKPIRSLTMYTMSEPLEKADTAGPYRKSLLYLVSRSFEEEQPTPILGLEESLRNSSKMLRFFGLAGTGKKADVLFSKTPPNAPLRDRTLATRHGGFDDDEATMSSLMRRVLDASESTQIVNFFQEELEPVVASAGEAGEVVASAVERVGAGTAPAPVATPAAVPQATAATPGPIVSPGPVASAAPKRRALCVGIDKYGPPYDLAGCVNDAKNWAKALKELRFDVTTLHDKAATRKAILEAFGSLVSSAKEGDIIVFQFAGHGTQADDLDGDEIDSLDEAFCPVDFPDGRLLIDDDVRAVISQLKPGVNLTCFIDCCHSGTITRALVRGRAASAPPGSKARFVPYSREISDRHRAFRATAEALVGLPASRGPLVEETAGEVCFSACQPHEVAYETEGAGQFTTRAVPLLSAAGTLTNAEFLARVTAAFGDRPPQHPFLDCREEDKERPLLGAITVSV